MFGRWFQEERSFIISCFWNSS